MSVSGKVCSCLSTIMQNYSVRKLSYLFLGIISLLSFTWVNLDAQTGPLLDYFDKEKQLSLPQPKVNHYRDLELTIKIRRLLAEDSELSQLNIGVSVRDGILRLWGPVPNIGKTQKVLAKVGSVKLVFDVKSDLYLGVVEDIPPPIFFKE